MGLEYPAQFYLSDFPVLPALSALVGPAIVIYSQLLMQTSVEARLELAFILVTLLVIAPCIAAGVGYAAWKGKPKNFDREMYWTVFVSIGAVAGFVIVYTQRAGETWPYPLQLACLGLGVILLGIALGFGIGIFARRRSSLIV